MDGLGRGGGGAGGTWMDPGHFCFEDLFLILFLGHTSACVKMPSASEPPSAPNEAPKERGCRSPGLRGVQTTTLFRAVNPELFIKPNKPVMAFGLITITLCVAYIGYLHTTQENKKDLYEAIDSEGTRPP
ncbi:PREDICTED: small integral membrane protein 8 isoform X2 [Crocodylus porosus]|uniref:small integral membrane protein 8 isoform X2 n=1 Tax=Crocodylus porosus TaxID=8502 RepID=UPI00093A3BDF|nr:PREDICTED: small integral membrane protein 8 isoform X2 [Crocodylus porosus]